MLELLPDSAGNVLALKFAGKLTDHDYRDVMPRLEEILRHYPKARFFIYVDGPFQGWEPAAAWDDLTFGLKHRHDFERAAVVGGPEWWDRITKIFAHLEHEDIRTFPAGQYQEAWDWVNA